MSTIKSHTLFWYIIAKRWSNHVNFKRIWHFHISYTSQNFVQNPYCPASIEVMSVSLELGPEIQTDRVVNRNSFNCQQIWHGKKNFFACIHLGHFFNNLNVWAHFIMKKFFFEKTFFVAARASCVLANIQNTHSILRVNIAKNAHQNACEIAQIAKSPKSTTLTRRNLWKSTCLI